MEISYTSFFNRQIKKLNKKYPSIPKDITILVDQLQENPFLGTHLGKDCYKIRLAISSKGKGKSGGSRVITCVKIVEDTIFLLSIYDKSEKSSISDLELDDLLELSGIVDDV
jgi:mRNA-degrading endonuclease RelE of RelBE toxin-antitoxin system